jgi:ubiquinone/menaquinone biosynthesis C-methylase UbiE
MKKICSDIYVCPITRHSLELNELEKDGDEIKAGVLSLANQIDGQSFEISDGIPEFLTKNSNITNTVQIKELLYYQENSEQYDEVTDWVFKSFYLKEKEVRNGLVDLLELSPSDTVLETGCGTCRDSEYILRRLENSGCLYLQDLSDKMLSIGRRRLQNKIKQKNSAMMEFFLGDAVQLPFPDNYFDAAYHFGGINLFSDIRKSINEMSRVVRVGGKVVIGDEGMAPWLRETEIGKILMNSHELYHHKPPMELLPEDAKNVCLRWIIENAFYVIDFKVGDRGPKVNLDLPILGPKGGTHRTRYYGELGE